MPDQSLPREVLRWIQSLDLAYSVKNVKRDFSNGFLVAEIFSRYYAKEISMHSYDNGNALKNKKDNWNQLIKVFRKIGLPNLISEQDANCILCCDDGTAVKFISKVYEVLTQRTIQTQIKKSPAEHVAGYARDTGSSKVKAAMKLADLDENSDIQTVTKMMSVVVENHERELLDDRSHQSLSQISSKKINQAPRGLDEMDENTGQVRIKEIQVKQIDRNVTHLRAAKQIGGINPTNLGQYNNQPGNVNNSPVSYSSKKPMGDYYSQSDANSTSAHSNFVPENSNSLLNACIGRVLNVENHPVWSNSSDPTQNLCTALELIGKPHENNIESVLMEVFREIGISSSLISDSCIYTPKQFWKVSDLFLFAISTTPFASDVFGSIIEAFEAIGKWCSRKDPKASIELFCDFSLYKLVPIIQTNPQKRRGILTVLYSFSHNDISSHLNCIKRLQMIVKDIPDFIYCLAVLSTLENEFDSSLIDIYMYYSSIGLSSQSPKLRSAGVFMLSVILPHTKLQMGQVVLSMLPELKRISEEESWWEIQGHLLSLCGKLIKTFSSKGPSSEAEDSLIVEGILELTKCIFSPKLPRQLQLIGLISIAPAVFASEELCSMFLNVLFQLDTTDRTNLLVSPEQGRAFSFPSSIGIPFVIDSLVTKWNPQSIAKNIQDAILLNSSERMEPFQMQCLAAAIISLCKGQRNFNDTCLGSFWVQLFNALKDYIFVGLCDPAACDYATYILSNYVYYSAIKGAAINDKKLIAALRLLYPIDGSGNKFCQSTVEAMFRNIYNADYSFHKLIFEIFDLFAKTYAAQYQSSSLQRLAKELS